MGDYVVGRLFSHNNAITANFFCYWDLHQVSAWEFWPHFGCFPVDPARVALSHYPKQLTGAELDLWTFPTFLFLYRGRFARKSPFHFTLSFSACLVMKRFTALYSMCEKRASVWKLIDREAFIKQSEKGAQKLYFQIKCCFTHGLPVFLIVLWLRRHTKPWIKI